ncbi:hypothetical protein Trydic_g6458 [Trypoxylus dichotomus]
MARHRPRKPTICLIITVNSVLFNLKHNKRLRATTGIRSKQTLRLEREEMEERSRVCQASGVSRDNGDTPSGRPKKKKKKQNSVSATPVEEKLFPEHSVDR